MKGRYIKTSSTLALLDGLFNQAWLFYQEQLQDVHEPIVVTLEGSVQTNLIGESSTPSGG